MVLHYRRSGMVLQRQTMLNTGWWEANIAEYLAPNAVAEAARGLGFPHGEVRLALARAAEIEGKKVGRWEIAAEVACAAAPSLQQDTLLAAARSEAVIERVRASSRAFDALQVNQRPAFLLQSEIGDRAVFSGLVHKEPLVATVEAMLHDVRAYRSFHAHFGSTPPTKG